MALFVAGGFTVLGVILDIMIITKYDFNPYGSFTLIFLCVGVLIGAVVGIRIIRRRWKPGYPLASPDPKGDIYFPRSNIPRPIHRDFREYPEYFKKKTRDDQRRR